VTGPRNPGRYEKMADMFQQGLTLHSIGLHFGCSRQYVQQCIKKLGVSCNDGGKHKTTSAKKSDKANAKNLRSLVKWGIPHTEMAMHRQSGLLTAYRAQKHNAKNRDVDWDLSFKDWLSIWQTSGKLDQRGRGIGNYVMSRLNDSGAYAMGNVHIQLSTENNREAITKRERHKAANTGVWFLYPGLERGWLAKYGRKHLGLHATEQQAVQARAAYLLQVGI